MAKKPKDFPKIKTIVEKAHNTYLEISESKKNKAAPDVQVAPNPIEDIKQLIAKVQETNSIPIEEYNEIARCYPRTKTVLREALELAKVYSFFPKSPSSLEFVFNAYLSQIEKLL